MAEWPHGSTPLQRNDKPMNAWGWILGSIPLIIGIGLIIAFVCYWIWTQNHVDGVVI